MKSYLIIMTLTRIWKSRLGISYVPGLDVLEYSNLEPGNAFQISKFQEVYY